VVVDGYNLLYARGEAPAPESRARLVRDLVHWATRRGRRVLLVFDAWERGARDAGEERHGPVTVHFTRHGQRADAYIVEWLEGRPEAVVVTSDRAVQQGARRRGAAVLDSERFLDRLDAVRAAPAGPASVGPLTAGVSGGPDEMPDDDPDEDDAPPGRRARGRARWLEGL
jgi:predicted RNA-binding protein with PIN domain